jgi:hypothetical protein
MNALNMLYKSANNNYNNNVSGNNNNSNNGILNSTAGNLALGVAGAGYAGKQYLDYNNQSKILARQERGLTNIHNAISSMKLAGINQKTNYDYDVMPDGTLVKRDVLTPEEYMKKSNKLLGASYKISNNMNNTISKINSIKTKGLLGGVVGAAGLVRAINSNNNG